MLVGKYCANEKSGIGPLGRPIPTDILGGEVMLVFPQVRDHDGFQRGQCNLICRHHLHLLCHHRKCCTGTFTA